MTDGGGDGISEKELTCAICTEILYQPLALLDCLHTFCGACLKEWFKWQATSASSSRRGTSNPYTCPSCRESVRRTKADWRLNSLLEGFLKAHPDKAKTEQERKELEAHYTPGEDVLPPVQVQRSRADREDDRMLAEVREMSMHDRRGERSTASRSRQDHVPRLTESTLRAHDTGQPQIEHQPSLRSLLSASDENSQDVQAEILRSIYSEGLLDGIDVDNLTPEQEEELTEKIAEAYRRRHRLRDRSGHRERQRRESRSPRSTAAVAEGSPNSRANLRENTADSQQQQTRSRPPVSRPHLFEQTLDSPSTTQRRSRSSISQRSGQSDNAGTATPPGTRSATDLSQTPSSDNAQQQRRRTRLTSTDRSVTDPQSGPGHNESPRLRHATTVPARETQAGGPAASDLSAPGSTQRPLTTSDTTSMVAPQTVAPPRLTAPHTLRPAVSSSAFAPEPVEDATDRETAPSITCNRCSRPNIQHNLHYNCRWCLGGAFNLCLDCYRNGQGCNHWFGFGYRALERWHRTAPPEGWPLGFDRPHVMSARRYIKSPAPQSPPGILEEGAFCDTCHSFANDGYWHCPICLEGAWGFCDTCVKRGRHCTHPLTYVAHLNSLQGGQWDPAKMSFVDLPHLRQDSYVNLPVDTGCDVCHRGIAANSTRFHCYECNDGDYDICNDCYRGLVAQGKINQANGPNGWRRCLEGHRLAIVGFQDTPEGGHVRTTIRDPVGGCSIKDDHTSAQPQHSTTGLPPDGGVGMRCLALYSYFPKEGVNDELAFPKYAEIREVERKNEDWFVGAYAGVKGLFPANHVRIL